MSMGVYYRLVNFRASPSRPSRLFTFYLGAGHDLHDMGAAEHAVPSAPAAVGGGVAGPAGRRRPAPSREATPLPPPTPPHLLRALLPTGSK